MPFPAASGLCRFGVKMPTPSILRVSPSSGPTSGSLFIEIVGAGFQVPALDGGDAPAPKSSVAVLVGPRPARDVRVLAADRLTCIVPVGDAGVVDVVVQNLDASGEQIPGEQAIAPEAFVYVRPSLTAEADLTRLVRALLHE